MAMLLLATSIIVLGGLMGIIIKKLMMVQIFLEC